ncbi:Serine aminopeptidase, S33 [Sesbania bispinosa]|nr:Serine aminopeptidase, S33 [Sesbania bispinosa]
MWLSFFKPIELQFQCIYFVTYTGLSIIQISTYGKKNSALQEEHTKGRIWRQLKNARGYTLQCSHYLPSPFPEDISLPCVIYCHGNSGCRADANEAAVILLPSNITVFTLDFSGSGLSDGDHVSLGWHEKDDLKMVVSYLRSNKQVSHIGLWGRSMGAVTSILYGAEDPSIAGMVLDSAFSNLYDLMMELVDVYKIRLPKFTVKMAVQYMRRIIEKKAKFDIMDLNCLQVAPKTSIPVLFGHVSIFFYNVLHPPHIPRVRKLEKYLGDYKIGSAVNESASTDAASSSSASPRISNLTIASVSELLSKAAPVTAAESMIKEDTTHGYDEPANVKVFATPRGSLREISSDPKEDEKSQKKRKGQTVAKKLKSDKFEKLESLSRRLRLCILKGSAHRRHKSS